MLFLGLRVLKEKLCEIDDFRRAKSGTAWDLLRVFPDKLDRDFA